MLPRFFCLGQRIRTLYKEALSGLSQATDLPTRRRGLSGWDVSWTHTSLSLYESRNWQLWCYLWSTVKVLEMLRPFVSLIPEVSKPERKVSWWSLFWCDVCLEKRKCVSPAVCEPSISYIWASVRLINSKCWVFTQFVELMGSSVPECCKSPTKISIRRGI